MKKLEIVGGCMYSFTLTAWHLCVTSFWLGTALSYHYGWHSHGKMLGLDDGEW